MRKAKSSRARGNLPHATGNLSRLAYAHAKAAGVVLDPALNAAGITIKEIRDSHQRLTVERQIRFLDLAAAALNDDYLGYHLAGVFDPRQVGLLYYVLASSQNLGEALQRAARYASIVNEGLGPKFIDGEQIGLTYHYVGVGRHTDRHQIEFFMAAIVRICRELTGMRFSPVRVRFTHRRRRIDRKKLAKWYGSHVEFGADTDDIIFAGRVRTLPIISADSYLNELLVAYCEDALARKRGQSFRASVENELAQLLPHGRAKASEVARRLGMSDRTFARRLAQEELTFSQVLENLRLALASRYLEEDDLSISQVAWLLGYGGVSSFSHAFKRWTGKAPRKARRRTAFRAKNLSTTAMETLDRT